MGLSSLHGCAQPGCPALVRGASRCREHRSRQDMERGSAHARGYDARWRRYRLAYLHAHPLCVLCEQLGRVSAASVVDHIEAHKGDEKLFWDTDNHRSLCKPCHDARTDEGDFVGGVRRWAR